MREFLEAIPRWFLGGGFLLSFFAAFLWFTELSALREETLRISKARSEILRKMLPSGELVGQAILPGTVAIIREKGGYYICGRSVVRVPKGPEYK